MRLTVYVFCVPAYLRLFTGMSVSAQKVVSLLQSLQRVASLGTQTQISRGTAAVAEESASADETS